MKEITSGELKAKLEAGDPVAIVDIRESDAYREWHIPGSTNIPVTNALKSRQDHALVDRANSLPKDRPIVTVCRAGVISQRAATVLESLGFDVATLTGGLRVWGSVWTEARIPLSNAHTASLIQVRRNGKGCLSYIVGSGDEAAVADPSVAYEAYTEIAEREGLRITRVLETHVHADHLSRARELCRVTGAELVLPQNDRVTFDYTPVTDGDVLTVGDLQVRVLATPGHTGESVCYLVGEGALLSGDTLFVDAVGRPDLEHGDQGAESAARMLYASLHEGLLGRVPHDVAIYPAHHGTPIGFDGQPVRSTVGNLRSDLELLGHGEEEFVGRVLKSLAAKPPNHERIIAINEGRARLDVDPLDVEAGPNRCAAG
jgi:glyoxylase-like metal-dependent hydrolase (beta-lactamase superfamily II)